MLPGGLSTLHAAALGGCAGAVPALAAAGAPLDARLAEGLPPEPALGGIGMLQQCRPRELDQTEELVTSAFPGMRTPSARGELLPTGATPLALACLMAQGSVVEALLAAGAAIEVPASQPDSSLYYSPRSAEGSPFRALQEQFQVGRFGKGVRSAAVAIRDRLLACLLERAGAGAQPLSGDQLLSVGMLALLPPTNRPALDALAALPASAAMGEEQRRCVVHAALELDDLELLTVLQAGRLRVTPLDPHGRLLQSVAGGRHPKHVETAKEILKVSGPWGM